MKNRTEDGIKLLIDAQHSLAQALVIFRDRLVQVDMDEEWVGFTTTQAMQRVLGLNGPTSTKEIVLILRGKGIRFPGRRQDQTALAYRQMYAQPLLFKRDGKLWTLAGSGLDRA